MGDWRWGSRPRAKKIGSQVSLGNNNMPNMNTVNYQVIQTLLQIHTNCDVFVICSAWPDDCFVFR